MPTALAPAPASAPWTAVHARHLLNRAGFGFPYSMVDRFVQAGREESVALFFAPVGDPVDEPGWLTDPVEADRERRRVRQLPEQERLAYQRQFRLEQRQAVERLKAWWLDRMRTTRRPLVEKTALFWHGHFATSAEKVHLAAWNYALNKTFREHGLGDFRDLVEFVGASPAMLRYLDNNQNRKNAPNENWARELLELFTLGPGNYTERDIQEAARAFSGYTFDANGFRLNGGQHDDGPKQFLGREGNFDGGDILDIIFEQPALPRFIGRKLWEFFVYPDPPDAIVEEVAAAFAEERFHVGRLLRRIFLSAEFYSDRAVGALIKSPVEFLLGLLEHLRVEVGRDSIVPLAARGLGQDLFYPPNVKGWPGGRAWITADTLLTRHNIAAAAVAAGIPVPRRARRLDEGADGADSMMSMSMTADSPANRIARRAMDKHFDPQEFFRPQAGRRVDDVVDLAIEYFIGRPLAPGQRDVLVRALGGRADAPLAVTRRDEVRLKSFTALLLSTADYQLC